MNYIPKYLYYQNYNMVNKDFLLDFVAGGVTVILTDHSNTERGYLAEVKQRLGAMLEGVQIVVSAVDRDPLEIV